MKKISPENADMPSESDLEDCEDVKADDNNAASESEPCFDDEGNRINKKMRL